MNTEFFIEMLGFESTSGRERGFADFLAQRMAGPGRRVETFEVPAMAGDCPDGCGIPVNLMVSIDGVEEYLKHDDFGLDELKCEVTLEGAMRGLSVKFVSRSELVLVKILQQ